MEKNWCCREFWFHLFPSSCFVTLGIHIWIIGIQSDSSYHKLLNDLGANLEDKDGCKTHPTWDEFSKLGHCSLWHLSGQRSTGKSMKIHHRNRWVDGFPIETLWISKEFRDFPRFPPNFDRFPYDFIVNHWVLIDFHRRWVANSEFLGPKLVVPLLTRPKGIRKHKNPLKTPQFFTRFDEILFVFTSSFARVANTLLWFALSVSVCFVGEWYHFSLFLPAFCFFCLTFVV